MVPYPVRGRAAASLRLSRLAAEAIEGVPALLRLETVDADGGKELAGMQPEPLPLPEIRRLQETMLRAERLLETDKREAALKSGRGLLIEQITAALEQEHDEHGHDRGDEPQDAEAEGSQQGTSLEASDIRALTHHMLLQTTVLEKAWSDAYQQQDVARLIAEWVSVLEALAAHYSAAAPLEGAIQFPPSEQLAQLDPATEVSGETRRLAEWGIIEELASLIKALREPTLRLTDSSGARLDFFSSAAFGQLRDRLLLLAELQGEGVPPPGEAALRRARQAALRADPEAVLLHLAAALPREASQLPSDDTAEGQLMRRALAAAERLGGGKTVPRATAAVLAAGALPLVESLLREADN